MELFDALHTRRSIRTFTAKALDNELIEKMLHAAMSAPSAGNAQPWLFLVITDKNALAQIPAVHPYAAMAPGAAAAILVCGNPGAEKHPGFWPQDCAAAVQNLLLAARAENVGSVWCGIHPLEERAQAFRRLFGLPAELVPFALVALGYTELEFTRRDRYDAGKVRWERWTDHA